MSNSIEKMSESEILALALKYGNEEMFKLLTDSPEILKVIQNNVFGGDIVEMVLQDPSRMKEFKELIEELKAGTIDETSLPKRLLN